MKANDWKEVLVILYIFTASIITFYLKQPRILSLFLLLQLVVVLTITRSLSALYPPIFLLSSFILFYALFQKNGASFKIGPFHLYQNGLKEGLSMSVKIYILIILTSIFSYRRERLLVTLKKMKLPESFLLTLDAVLSFRTEKINLKEGIRELLRGKTQGIAHEISKRRKEIEANLKGDSTTIKDVSLVSSLAFFYLITRYIRIAPGLPFSPGYKNILIIPLYITASSLSKGKMRGTLFGFIAGMLSLPFGNKYGLFGILKEILPGIISDLIPAWKRLTLNAIKGGILGLSRFSTIIVLALLADVPDVYYAFLTPFMLSHILFGVLGGIVSHYLVKSLENEKNT